MSPLDARRQAAALRLVAERVERGETLSDDLADALATDIAQHPDELAAVDAHEGALPKWMADELDRRDRDDKAWFDNGLEAMARLLAKHAAPRRSA